MQLDMTVAPEHCNVTRLMERQNPVDFISVSGRSSGKSNTATIEKEEKKATETPSSTSKNSIAFQPLEPWKVPRFLFFEGNNSSLDSLYIGF